MCARAGFQGRVVVLWANGRGVGAGRLAVDLDSQGRRACRRSSSGGGGEQVEVKGRNDQGVLAPASMASATMHARMRQRRRR